MTISLSNTCRQFLQNPSDDYRFCLKMQPADNSYTLTVSKKNSPSSTSNLSDNKIYNLHTIITKVQKSIFIDDKKTVHLFYHELSRRVVLYRNKHPEKPCGNLSLFQDIPRDIYRLIAKNLSSRDEKQFLSTSKRTYTVNCLSADSVSKIVSQYYALPEKERKPSPIVNEILQSKDFSLNLHIDSINICNLPLEILKDSVSIALRIDPSVPIQNCLSTITTVHSSVLTKVKSLIVNKTEIKSLELATLLEKFPNLEELDISECYYITDQDLSIIGNTKIKKLIAMAVGQLTSKGLSILLEKCPNLEELNITECKKITDLDLSTFGPTKIKKISTMESKITSQGLIALLKVCPDLEELDIFGCWNITDLDLTTLSNTKIKKINAYGSHLTSQGLIALLKICPDLEVLNIGQCSSIENLELSTVDVTKIKILINTGLLSSKLTAESVIALLHKCPDLEELYISGSDTITHLDLTTFGPTKIKKLSAGGISSKLSSQGLLSLLEICPDLEELYLANCEEITTRNLSTFILTKVKKLHTEGHWFILELTSQKLAALLKICPNLEELHIAKCNIITDSDLSTFGPTKIKKILIADSKITSEDLVALLKICPDLEELSISNCDTITTLNLTSLGTTSIKKIHIPSLNLTSKSLATLLEKCPKLEDLNMIRCKNIPNISSYALKAIMSSTNNKKLNASSSDYNSQELIAMLEACPYLETLDISNCENITNLNLTTLHPTKIKKLNASSSALTSQGLSALLEKCPYLEKLDISNCENITNLNLTTLHPTKIKKLDASESELTSQELTALLQICPDLEELNIFGCWDITDLDLTTLSNTKIKSIQAGVSKLTSKGLSALLEKCPDLEKLNISVCWNITDLDLTTLSDTKIQNIQAGGSKLTSKGLSALLEKCPDLKMLDISYCQNIIYRELSAFAYTKIKSLKSIGYTYSLTDEVIVQMKNFSISRSMNNWCDLL